MRLVSRQTRLIPNGWSIPSSWQPNSAEIRLPSTPTWDPSGRDDASHSCALGERRGDTETLKHPGVPAFINRQNEGSSFSACRKYLESVHRRASVEVTTAESQRNEGKTDPFRQTQ